MSNINVPLSKIKDECMKLLIILIITDLESVTSVACYFLRLINPLVDRRSTRMYAAKETEEREEGQLFSPSFSPLLPSIPSSVQYGAFSSLDPLLGEKV